MLSIFQECSELRSLDLSNFDTSKIDDLSWMFCECKKLKEIKGINKLKLNKIHLWNECFNYVMN